MFRGIQMIFIFVLLSCSMNSIAQKKNKRNEDKPAVMEEAQKPRARAPIAQVRSKHENVYSNAMINRDYDVALNALYYIFSQDSFSSTYRDSLAYVYYVKQDFGKSIVVCKTILKDRPDNMTITEMMAISYRGINNLKEALMLYEIIQSTKPHPIYLYKIAELQFGLKRNHECVMTLTSLMQSDKLDSIKISMAVTQYQGQNVPMKAAIHNMRGMVELEKKDNEEAKKWFKKALVVFPEFYLASENLKILEKKK